MKNLIEEMALIQGKGHLEHAQELATKWLWTYNNERPNTAIGGVPPRFLTKAA